LDFLANFNPRPPIEEDHRKRHLIDRYLDVLQPLGIKDGPNVPKLRTRAADDQAIERMLRQAKADTGAPLVGLFPGAGHPSRRWPVERFSELADFVVRNHGARVLVFAGPEERALLPKIRTLFPKSTLILDKLTIPQLAAAQARLAVFVSNDTGPMHIAAAVGSPLVLLLDKRAPESYLPRAARQRVIYSSTIPEIRVEEVYAATRELLASARTETLFAS
jgi:ADP-heptose:LPS heptosyltransferase